MSMLNEAEIGARFEMLSPSLDERTRRLADAAEAAVIGHGGVPRASRATRASRRAIHSGLARSRPPPGLPATIASVGSGADATRRWRQTPPSRATRGDRSIRRLAVTRSRRRGGPARVSASRRGDSGAWDTPPADAWSSDRSTGLTTAVKPTARLPGGEPPGSGCSIRAYRREVRAASRAGEPVISVDAEEEEPVGGSGRRLRECRAAVASRGTAGSGEGVRLHHPGTRPRRALWGR